ncbi:MAG: DUF2804 domain-containing protein [Clostridiales bacterium]|nr:DUF2804 domain-containing protein [Clostridiales bacterium]
MENKPLLPSVLLSDGGIPLQFGYSKKPIIQNNPENIKHPFRYKEWDFYQVSDKDWTLQITFGHVSYAGAINAALFNYSGERYEATLPLVLPMRKLGLAPSAGTSCHLQKHTKNLKIDIIVSEGKRAFDIAAKTKHGDCEIKLTLSYPADAEGILVVTPFGKPYEFYHNYKQSCMQAEGYAKFGDVKAVFEKDKSFGLIDWGRGILPFSHKWWWGNGSHKLEDGYFGFNIGVFGNTEFASENAVFYNHKTHKLGRITYTRGENYTDPWYFTSDDKRFEMAFTPIFDNYTTIKLLWVNNACHQVFGYFNGKVVLDDGKTLVIKDMLAFVEEANNNW